MLSASTSKPEDVVKYKRREYVKLGFTDYQSRRLVECPGLDVGTVRAVLEKGCPVNIAYRIYRP